MESIQLRDYQLEAIQKVKENKGRLLICKYCVYYCEGYCWNFMEETDKDDSCDSFIKDESKNKK